MGVGHISLTWLALVSLPRFLAHTKPIQYVCVCQSLVLCILFTLFVELLHSLFNVIYDLDIVDDKEFYMWRDDDQVMYGKSAAVASTKPFFDWLKSDSKSADWM